MSRFCVALLTAAICSAQAPRHTDLTEVGLEELMNIEVISVSKREQKLARTPAAVSILTQEDTFYNIYRNLVTSALGRPDLQFAPAPHLEVPVTLENGLRGETYGLEVDANWRPVERWRLSGSYTGLEVQLHAPPGSTNPSAEHGEGLSPHHQFSIASYLDVTRRVQFDTIIYRVGALPGSGVAAYTRCDARVGWRPRESLEVSVGSQNLSGHRQVEYVSEVFVHSTRVGRRYYGKLTWTF